MRWLVRDEAALPPGLDWLTADEARRAAGYSFPKRRTEYLLRRLVAKDAVAATLGLDVARSRIAIANAPGGAPYALVDGTPAGIEVSISDRAGRAVCVVGTGRFGCDLELVEPRSPGFVRDFLTGVEADYVGGSTEPDVAANLVWSAKESALKLLHSGLDRDTRSVVVTVHNGQTVAGWAPLSVVPSEGGRWPGWWRRDGRFLFTVVAEEDRPPPVPLEEPST